ncbi:rho-related protein rac1B-like [Gigantopelta aegis]|uniref:rho-related protein rac1B-like n=1 Tax=Gigantopelta aegis TaxID=1735272 RepID=UPI001B88AB24|nr:rho-related protein rac1B-like [Gigantopelta aegis]
METSLKPVQTKDFKNKDKLVKCTVIGDSGVGKTCLLLTYVTRKYPNCVPASFEWHLAGSDWRCGTYPSVQVDGIKYNLDFSDTLGMDEYKPLRVIAYTTTDVFVICYDISNRESLTNATGKWILEIKQSGIHAPIILVGTKLDLRSNYSVAESPGDQTRSLEDQNSLVQHKEGLEAAKRIRAADYIECSALTNDGVTSVFLTAAHAALHKISHKETSKKQGCHCVVL